jgi:hypothetical protein
MVVHLLDAFVHARQIRQQLTEAAMASTANTAPSTLQPVSWDIVFGPNADPSLITDGKRGLDYVLSDALKARISFNAAGESALAARFANVGGSGRRVESLRFVFPIRASHRQRRWRLDRAPVQRPG